MNMAGAHTETVLNKLSQPDLVQLILTIETNLGSQIAKLTTEAKDLPDHSKKLEADLAIARNVNNKLVQRYVAANCQCWKNVQYSRRDTLKVVGIPTSVRDKVLEQKFVMPFFTNRKNCLQILSLKKHVKGLDPAAVNLPEVTKTFINESLYPYYRGIWCRCKKGQTKRTSLLHNKWFNSFMN